MTVGPASAGRARASFDVRIIANPPSLTIEKSTRRNGAMT